jgi:hypothetical protein
MCLLPWRRFVSVISTWASGEMDIWSRGNGVRTCPITARPHSPMRETAASAATALTRTPAVTGAVSVRRNETKTILLESRMVHETAA